MLLSIAENTLNVGQLQPSPRPLLNYPPLTHLEPILIFLLFYFCVPPILILPRQVIMKKGIKPKCPVIEQARLSTRLRFHTFSFEKIGKGHFKLYCLVVNKEARNVIVECEYMHNVFFDIKFYDRHAIPFEQEQAISYFTRVMEARSGLPRINRYQVLNKILERI